MESKNYMELEIADEFKKVINNSDKLVVVDFYAEWCMPCLMLSPVIEELAEKIKDAKFVKINIDGNEELAEKYDVSRVPCLVFFKNGKEINRIIGSHSADSIELKIKSCLK